MSAIKDFFKKKKADAKFKLAGSGHKLSEPSAAPRGGPGPSGGQRPGPERAPPSQSSQQAGAAALNRFVREYIDKYESKVTIESRVLIFKCFIQRLRMSFTSTIVYIQGRILEGNVFLKSSSEAYPLFSSFLI